MSEDKEVHNLKMQYKRKIENIQKRTAIHRSGIDRFKADFRTRPLVMNVKVIRNLFDINNDAERLKVYESGLKDLAENPDHIRDIKKEVARVNAEINRRIEPRRREMNLAINIGKI